jgi:hypothetical protein
MFKDAWDYSAHVARRSRDIAEHIDTRKEETRRDHLAAAIAQGLYAARAANPGAFAGLSVDVEAAAAKLASHIIANG